MGRPSRGCLLASPHRASHPQPLLVTLGEDAVLLGPASQLRLGALPSQRPVLHPQREQVPVGPTHQGARRNAEQRHDLVAVQVRPDRVELFLATQLGDASFLVFRLATTGAVAVVFRRPDGRVGLIEPEP